MKRSLVLFFILSCALPSMAQAGAPFLLQRSIELPGVTGKFDHFAIDTPGHRLFVAATGNHSVEVIDLTSDRVVESIKGLGKPHGLAWVNSTGSLYVADGSLRELRLYQGKPLTLAGKISLSDDADDMVYDEADHLLFVGHGGSDAANPAKVAIVSTDPFSLIASLPVATHPEALEIDPQSQRVFANIAESNEVAVIGAKTRGIVAHWKLTKAADNVPLAFDADHRLLFVACRKPGMLLALDAATGRELTSAASAEQADDLFYDSVLHRVYLISGAGEVDSYQVDAGNALHVLPAVHTVSGAKTALFVPAENLLYVGVPSANDRAGEVRVYKTNVQ
jgi:DNA-binding beta-propeller fold protein YncE